MREELKTREEVFRVYGRRARVLAAQSSGTYEHVLFEVQGLAIIAQFRGDHVEHAYPTNGDDVLDEETHVRYPYVISDEARVFAISKGWMEPDRRTGF